MDKLIFATNNANKTAEIKKVLNGHFNVISLTEAGIDIDIPEPHNTLEANAREKSRTIYTLTGNNCFSEDTGLFVDALNGEPGVKSARYAGDNAQANIDKLLEKLGQENNRTARFRTVISLILNGQEYQFEGICEGKIINSRQGSNGFGYDAVFVPEGSTRTFAEMDMAEKNLYSHRKKAVEKMVLFLTEAQTTPAKNNL
jgi:XTP/dITP diphosphohydrolase